MNKFWSWFIPFILIICIIIYMLIVKVNNQSTIEVDNLLNEPKLIGNYEGKNFYSIFDTVKIDKMDINDYLNNNNIDSLIKKMTFIDGLDDGGTKMYYANTINNKIYLINCKTLSENYDIYLLNELNVEYCND